MFQQIARFSQLVYLSYLSFTIKLEHYHRFLDGNVKQLNVYLKSLIVRPAVWWVLALLNEGLKHHYWAGLTDYTSPFGFAIGYVFDKQSGGPCY